MMLGALGSVFRVRPAARFVADSLLEGGGFEPSVPVKKKPIYVVPKGTLLRVATRIGDRDIG